MIRKAMKTDIPRIHELLRQVNEIHQQGRSDLFKLANKYQDDELEELLNDEKRPIFVITNHDEVQGYAFCILEEIHHSNLLYELKTLYIDDFCIDEACRGTHLGTQLMSYVKEYAKSCGCYNVTLNVWSFNESAIKFYKKCGMFPQKIKMETIL